MKQVLFTILLFVLGTGCAQAKEKKVIVDYKYKKTKEATVVTEPRPGILLFLGTSLFVAGLVARGVEKRSENDKG